VKELSPEGCGERLRALLPADGVGEWPDGTPVALPATDEEMVETVRFAAREGLALLPVGAGTKLGWTHPPERVDLVLSTRRYAGIVAYEPAEGTLTARAGSRWSDLVAATEAGGHHLSPLLPYGSGDAGSDASSGYGATLGGVVAAGESGFDRLRFGPLRHQLLGTRVLLADGRIAKSGGALVKNVTGYDLHRLHCGSHGTLCVVLEASLRLYPLPACRAVFRSRHGTLERALTAEAGVRGLSVSPLASCVHDLEEGSGWELLVALAGRAETVADERARLRPVLGAEAVELVDDGADGPAADAIAATAALERRGGRWPELSLSCTPRAFGGALAGLLEAAGELGLEVATLAHPGLARASLWFATQDSGQLEASLDPERLERLHERAQRNGRDDSTALRLRWLAAPPELARKLDVFGPATRAAGLMRALKRAFDPDGLFARGRFHDRI